MLGQAPNMAYRVVWIMLLSGCAFTFVYQAIAVVDKYYRMDKITDIQLKFDTVFEKIMRKAANTDQSLEDLEKAVEKAKTLLPPDYSERKIRDTGGKGTFEPANSVCVCEDDNCEADAPKRGIARATGNHQHTFELAKLCREAIKEDLKERGAAVMDEAADAGKNIRKDRPSFANYKAKMTSLRRPDETVTASRRAMGKVFYDFHSHLFDSRSTCLSTFSGASDMSQARSFANSRRPKIVRSLVLIGSNQKI
ncbi:unnamed protein product [Haemonchus placei]|uniref:Col_cuticle_N domain-containing protein n=1 Tax=Haemonchus placei TaxID=6290 RepID=A0A0N4W0S6_HAEPC|nr:unnamed protein product [Haemonchus placei]